MNNSIKLKGPNGKRFSQRTPDLGCMIGRNSSSSIDRGMRGLSQVRAMEMMNSKKIAISMYEATYLRSSIAVMKQEKVRKAMREDLMNTYYMTDPIWEKFDSIIFDPLTRLVDAARHLWDFPCLSYSNEARSRRSISALIHWLKKTHGLEERTWNEVEALKVAKGIHIGNVIAFKNPDGNSGDVGYSIGIVFKLPDPFSEFKEFDPTFHVDRMQPVDDNVGTSHVGSGSGTWWRNGPATMDNGNDKVVLDNESTDICQINPEKILWSEMEWEGLARPIIELNGAASLNMHPTAKVWKLKSAVNTLIMRHRLKVQHFNVISSKMRASSGGISLRRK